MGGVDDYYPPGSFGAELQKVRAAIDALPWWMRLSPRVRRMRREVNRPDFFRVGEHLPAALRDLGLDEAAWRVEGES